MDPRIQAYNAAGAALQAAVERVREASAEDMPAAETALRDAQAEFTRCEAVVRALDSANDVPAFQPRATDNPNHLGMDARDVRNYSIVRAIRALVSGNWSDAQLEREASDAIAEQLGRDATGFFLPADIQRRDMVVGTDSAGGYLVASELRPQSFIEMLRNRMSVVGAGATVLGGLVGDVAIPRQTGGATGYWVAESGSPTEGAQTVDQVSLTPKTYGAFTDISRKLLKQSSVDVEAFVTRDLAATCALGIDAAALHGTGSNNQPTGIAATSGIGSVAGGTNGAAPTWANIVDLETQVAIDNADIGTLAYMTNAKVRGKLKSTAKVSSTDSKMIWDDGDMPLNGYACHVTNQVSSALTKGTSSGVASAIFFGNWADLIIGQWGTVDILVDPYTGSSSGTVRVVALQDVDVAVRHAESFAAMLDALTA